MASPKDLIRLSDAEAERLARFYAEAEREILNELNKALLRGNKTEYLAQMKRNIEAILRDLRAGNRTWCEGAIPRIYLKGVEFADGQLQGRGVKLVAGFGAIHQQAAQVLAENTFLRLDNVAQVIGRRSEDIYRTLALENIRGSVVGFETWKQVARNFREDLAKRGVTGFQDAKNREWNMRSYSEMVARTSTMEAHLQGTANRLLEHGHDLVKVSTHVGACELCQPYQGKVLSLTGKTEGYPTLEEARADGLFHPRCRHAYGLHINLDEEIRELEEEMETDKDISIPQSLGAAARRIYVDKEIGVGGMGKAYLKPGTYITGVRKIAEGKEIRVIQRLIDKYLLPDGSKTQPRDWQKMRGSAIIVNKDVEHRAEVHWYQAKNIGKVKWKIKRLLS